MVKNRGKQEDCNKIMRNILIIATLLFVGFPLLAQGQTKNSLSVRIDPDDWNQLTYTHNTSEKDSVLFHYWVKRNKDQFVRVNWQRTEKVSKHWSLSYGFGGQAINNRAGFDPQGYALLGTKATAGKLSANSSMNFNISTRRPMIVKNVTIAQVKASNKLALGYRHEIAISTNGTWPEIRLGGTADYALTSKVTVGAWAYRNEKTNRFGTTVVLGVKF
jgi:hypothetical protein